jgi:hypothetical protein
VGDLFSGLSRPTESSAANGLWKRLDTDVGAREVEDVLGALRMAYTADAVLEHLSTLVCCRCWNGRGGASVRRSLEQPRSASSVRLKPLSRSPRWRCLWNRTSSLKDLFQSKARSQKSVKSDDWTLKTLPLDWHKTRDESLRRFGDEWTLAEQTIARQVPSAAIRGEWNVHLNPTHLDFQRVARRAPIGPFARNHLFSSSRPLSSDG